MQKNFPSFFRKIFFFHRPCANLLDFSSSLICLSESAFSQRSRSLPTLKVAPRSAAGPGPRRSSVPARGWRQHALCLQYAHFPLDEAWEPRHRSELGSRGQRARSCHDTALPQRQGCWRSCWRSHCSHCSVNGRAARLYSPGAERDTGISPGTTSTPAPAMLISSFIHGLC